MNHILSKAMELEDELVRVRRKIHENPELSGLEFETQKLVMDELDQLGIPYRKVGNTSIIGVLKGNKPGKVVALRADMDALPIQEEADVSFRSKNPGIMHACGHDGHTAMLLGAAKILHSLKEEISGEIRFFFQEGEETLIGAKHIIEAGGMEGVDACFGIHGSPELETGWVGISPGYRMAGCDTITVRFEGVSGHGSAPHLAKDTIHPACLFVTDLQGIVTKNVAPQEPMVLSVGKFVGGTKVNIVSKYTMLEITMRYFNREVQELVHQAIRRHGKAIGDAYEIKVDVDIEKSTTSLYNDEECCTIAIQAANQVFGEGKNKDLPMQMASEDMAYYMEAGKGVFCNLGYINRELGCIYPPHHEKFKLDEGMLKYGTALHVQFALDFLTQKM